MVEIVLCASILLWHGGPSSILHPRAFSKLDAYQSEVKDILFPLQFEYLYHVVSNLFHLISFDASEEIRYSWKQF